MKTYKQEVTRVETFTVSEQQLNKERMFQRGKSDRTKGLLCRSANGAYLDGWYSSPEQKHYFIPEAAAHLI